MNPKLKAYPIAVCGDVEERHGIVLAKNYAAKAKGVSTGEAIWQAKQKCPGLVIVPPHYEEYMKFSRAAKEIYSRYTDEVEPFGMDECWLDVSGSTRIFGDGEKIANEIREKIKFELGLTISAGVSFNKIFAKLGSDMITQTHGEHYFEVRHQTLQRAWVSLLKICDGMPPFTMKVITPTFTSSAIRLAKNRI